MNTTQPHIPVMLREVLSCLSPKDGELYVDGTFGAGGYSRAILESANCRIIGIDRDSSVFKIAEELQKRFMNRLTLLHGCFGDVESLLKQESVASIDALVLDLGVSSMQIDTPDRGFSFRYDGPLDMRMDAKSGQRSASDLVNDLPEEDLCALIRSYGEDPFARRIARVIAKGRAVSPIRTTEQLANLIRSVAPKGKKGTQDPATRTFQALRIAVNDELGELERALQASEHLLRSGGRLVVVTFHSLEDRIVKNFLSARSKAAPNPSRHLPVALKPSARPPLFSVLTKKPLEPSPEETQANPRARSARLRAAIRTEAPSGNKEET